MSEGQAEDPTGGTGQMGGLGTGQAGQLPTEWTGTPGV